MGWYPLKRPAEKSEPDGETLVIGLTSCVYIGLEILLPMLPLDLVELKPFDWANAVEPESPFPFSKTAFPFETSLTYAESHE